MKDLFIETITDVVNFNVTNSVFDMNVKYLEICYVNDSKKEFVLIKASNIESIRISEHKDFLLEMAITTNDDTFLLIDKKENIFAHYNKLQEIFASAGTQVHDFFQEPSSFMQKGDTAEYLKSVGLLDDLSEALKDD